MPPTVRFAIAAVLGVVAFDAVASLAARQLGFPYPRAAFGSWALYATLGFLATRAGAGVTGGALVGAAAGLADATLGWAASWIIGPGRLPAGTLTPARWAVAAMIVVTTAVVLATLGGAVGSVLAGRHRPAAA